MLGRTLAIVACLALAGGSPAYAKSEKAADKAVTHGAAKTAGKAKTGTSGTDATAAAAAAAGAVLAGVLLSDQDRATISRYFQQHPQPATALPPGIAKNVARGKPIPPGIAKRGVPNGLSGQLSIPSGYELQTIGTDVVLIEAGTRIIADVLKDVLRK
ncbi:anti-virulence regulator CigR family protein [Thalassobaculum sp.]|uniref:anti-virulence regulator CigR family protein n=1 Tax=Thalassobaculum sp. TaxID=2022740 RepID=UPI0032EE38BF